MTRLNIKYSGKFKKQLKKIIKQGKDINKLINVVDLISKREELDFKYRDHQLVDNKYYQNCRKCHIEHDWLLVYKYNNEDEVILFLVATGSHSEIFSK